MLATVVIHPIMSKPKSFVPQAFLGPVLERLSVYLAYIGGSLFIIEALISVFSVAGRTFFSAPVPGDYELIQILSAVGIALCMPYCQLRHGHVFVDFFTLWAPASLKRVLDSFACFLLSIVAFAIAWRNWAGMEDMREYMESSMVLGVPLWWGYLPITPAFVVFGLVALYTMAFGWEKTSEIEAEALI